MRQLEAISKRAALVSVLAIVVSQLLLHPDATWLLRAAGSVSLVVGWIAARTGRTAAHAGWLLFAPLAPALLMRLSGRQGEPLLDIVWMAGLAGFLARTVSWSRWNAAPLWRVLLGGWALTLALAWPVMVARETGFDVSLVRDIGAINSWAGLSTPHVIAWTNYVVITQLLGLLWFDWVCGELREGARALPRAVHGLWIGVTIASLVAIIQGAVDIDFLNTPFWAERMRAGGTMLNPNAYGIAAACAGPIGLLAVRALRPGATALGLMVLGINWAGMWLSGSRTATFVCGAAGALGLAAGVLRSRERASVSRIAVAAAAVGVVAAAAVLATRVSDPLERLGEIPLSREGVAILVNRDSYGPIANRMLAEHPLTGVGVGAYHYLAPDYERADRDEQLPFDNAQNWWRHEAAEFGVLGALSVLVFSLLVAWRTLAGRTREGAVTESWTARALLAGIGVVSLLGMPTQSPVVLLFFYLLVAWMAATTTDPVPATPPPAFQRAAWIAVTVLAGAYAASHVVLARGPLAVDERARRFRFEHVAGAYGPEPSGDGPPFRWTDDESRFVVPARGRWMLLRLWAYHPDIEEQPVHVRLTNACGGVFYERDLTSARHVRILVEFDDPSDVFDVRVTPGRTWRPGDSGAEDPRQLGVAVLADFLENSSPPDDPDDRVRWQDCRG